MSNDIINLRKYRNAKRDLWRQKHHARLESFIQQFVDSTCPELREISGYGFQWQCHTSETAWDYQDFRDLLHNSLEELSRVELYRRLRTQWWFDATLISNGEVLESFLAILLEAPTLAGQESL